jgi:signal transduction histidine kinase
LVNTLLDLAKIEAGQMEVVKIRSDVRELCNSVLSIHRYGVEQKGLMLNVKFQADIPPTILTDHIKLMQILNNLLSNAVKFTDNGAIFLSVEMDQGSWVFSVADTGIGMNAEQLSNVFNRFNNVKLDDSQSADRPGAGLGMALCKDFAELLDGSLHVYSELRVGTVVKLILPYLDDDSTKI